MNRALTIETLSFDEFCRLEEPWDDLVAASRTPLPFLVHRWLRLWWRHFGEAQEFVALVVRDGERLLAGVPLALRPLRFPGHALLVGEIVGTGSVPTRGMGLADKADLLVRRDAPDALASLCRASSQLLDRVDILDVKGFDEGSLSATLLSSAAGRTSGVRQLSRSVSPFLILPATWEDYLRSRSGNFRKHLKKYRRQLHEAGKVEIARGTSAADCVALMREVLEISGASWQARRGTNLFRHPGLRAFFLELSPVMAEKGWLDLHVMRIDSRPVAYELCFDFGGRLFSYNGSFRADHARLSPGTALTAWVIESACARGRTEYDMLREKEAYKLRWSETSRNEHQILLTADRWRARIYSFAGLYSKEKLKSSLWVRELGDRVSGLVSRLRFRA